MSLQSIILPKTYLPVILPPLLPLLPRDYYDKLIVDLGVLVNTQSNPDGSLEITIVNSHKSCSPTQSTPFSTVYAPTNGFVRLTADEDKPQIVYPANASVAALTLRVWSMHSGYNDILNLSPAAELPSPNRIIFAWLDADSIKAAITTEIRQNLKTTVLERAWQVWQGSPPPQNTNRDDLESKFVDQFMQGNAEVFVTAGTTLGRGITIDANNTAQVKMRTFLVPPTASDLLTIGSADYIDNELDRSVVFKLYYESHPLRVANSGAIDINFSPTFTIWDNSRFQYVPFVNATVVLKRVGSDIPIASATTDSAGQIHELKASPEEQELIYFEYCSKDTIYGTRLLHDNVTTPQHRARCYVNKDGDNRKEYKAKYDFYAKYELFIDDLAAKEAGDPFDDRGNASAKDNSKSILTDKLKHGQHQFLKTIKISEGRYRRDILPQKMLTVMFEGDSWFHYPLAYADIYRHLRQQLQTGARRLGCTVNIFPFQHFGDRSDQMFVPSTPPDPARQWDLTRDFLAEYKIDLIVCSGGGNDFADPGVSSGLDPKVEAERPYTTCFDHGYFDPSQMPDKLNAKQQKAALERMNGSFAILLNNHRWHLYCSHGTQESEEAYSAKLSELLAKAVKKDPKDIDFGADNYEKLSFWKRWFEIESIGKKVWNGVPKRTELPKWPNGDGWDNLMAAICDLSLYRDRFDGVMKNWHTLLNATQDAQIPVITHSYCYPLYCDTAPSAIKGVGKPITGPWFVNRFREANITDRRIQAIVLKILIDNYFEYVLSPLHREYPRFDVVDVREENQSRHDWRDEMHLRGEAFKRIAEKMYDKIQGLFPTMLEER